MGKPRKQLDNSGSLFTNKDKTEENPNWADYSGNAMIDGREYYVSGWKKVSQNGTRFMSLAFRAKQPKLSDGGSSATAGGDDVPADEFF